MHTLVSPKPAAISSADEKRARVLDAAMHVFLAYGFQRTTMDQIARAAELSRPALYLVFRNKTDIYRALARELLSQVLVAARAELEKPGTLLEKLDAMMCHAFFDILKPIEASPHGSELYDMRNALAGDICARWREELCDALEKVVAQEVAASGADLTARGLSPRDLAHVFFDSLEGMKVRLNDPVCHLDASQTSVRVLVAALRP